ncbi:MAG: BglII/BstYI family type II restriction endonuclease [Aestuariivirga sp.]
MRIVETYSHLNGLEYLMVHKPELWREIKDAIAEVDAHALRTKISKEKGMVGKALYAPTAMNKAFDGAFKERGWSEQRTSYWVTSDASLIRKTLQLSAAEQNREIIAAKKIPISSYNQTDFVKE